ncbi:MAG: ERF family protein [Akkermansiaceae bacterium]
MTLEHATPALFAAMANAQATLENASKSSINPHFRSNYADLAEVLNRIRPVFSAVGLAIIQSPSFDGERVTVETAITHADGGWIAGHLSCVPGKSDAQGIGSAVTYLRRYSLAALAGLAQEDDDGQSARHDQKPTTAPAPRKAPPKQSAAPTGPTRREMLNALRESYQAANVADGEIAAAIMRRGGYLADGVAVADMDEASLRRAFDKRESIFRDDDVVMILDRQEA